MRSVVPAQSLGYAAKKLLA